MPVGDRPVEDGSLFRSGQILLRFHAKLAGPAPKAKRADSSRLFGLAHAKAVILRDLIGVVVAAGNRGIIPTCGGHSRRYTDKRRCIGNALSGRLPAAAITLVAESQEYSELGGASRGCVWGLSR